MLNCSKNQNRDTSGGDERPVGVFDSGMGGLTAVKELTRLLPKENILYFGDTARVPYGSHSRETIIRFSKQIFRFLLDKNIKAVMVACGTVSSIALKELSAMTTIPIIGVIEPTVRKAVSESKNKKIAVFATEATIRSHAYQNELKKYDGGIECMEVSCPILVPLIENGYTDPDNPIMNAVLDEYLEKIYAFHPDTLILGCTHYPLISGIIKRKIPHVSVIEAGREAAKAFAALLDEQNLFIENDCCGKRRYIVSEKTDTFIGKCNVFLGDKIEGDIEVCDLESYFETRK